jgi:hypothetical protein
MLEPPLQNVLPDLLRSFSDCLERKGGSVTQPCLF